MRTANQISDNRPPGTAMPHSPASKSPTYTPPHWPKHIQYLTAQQYHLSVSKDILDIIRGRRPPEPHQNIKPQLSFVVIRKITGSSDHPASAFRVCKGAGTHQTEVIVSITQAGCGTIWIVCGEKDTATNVSAGLSGRSSLR